MRFDDDPDEERPGPDRLLPPEDRLWRHPSEVAASHHATPPTAPGPTAAAAGPRRSAARSALAGACLAGAVVAVGAMWIARPTRVVEREVPTTAVRATAAAVQSPTYLAGPVPTEAMADRLGPTVARLEVEHDGRWTQGTALWIDDRGTLAAAAPLVAGATTLVVTGRDGRAQDATLIGVDEASGVAALAVERTAGTPVTAAPAPPGSGAQAAVVGAGGTDAGDDADAATLAAVVIRSKGLRASVGDLVIHDSVQLDRAVPADVTGGALVNGEGDLLGMVVGNSTERGLGTAVPAATVTASAADLRDHGRVRRAWLGVRAVDLQPDRAAELAVDGGAVLTEVTADSPAAGAGLAAGDIVTQVGDTPVDDASDLVNGLARQQPGAETTLTYLRDGTRHTQALTLGG